MLTKERPLEVRAVLDEGCIRRMVGGPEVMHQQITRLLKLAELPNVIIQVLPFSVRAHPGTMLGPFTVLGFENPADPGVVYVEGDSDPYPDREGDLERYTLAFDHLRSMPGQRRLRGGRGPERPPDRHPRQHGRPGPALIVPAADWRAFLARAPRFRGNASH